MNIGRSTNINDNIHETIYMTDFEKRISSTTLFNRLHYVYQNSTVYLTFPSNQTKRYEHSFGTMELCSQIFFYSISNADPKTIERFFKLANSAISKIVDKIEVSERDYSSKLQDKFRKVKEKYKQLEIEGGIFNNLSPLNIIKKHHTVYCILLESIRIAALLHDVGHPPFSHIVEFALKNVFDSINNMDDATLTDRQKEFKQILGNIYCNKRDLHESISFNISEKLLHQAIKDISLEEGKKDAILLKQLFEVLVKECVMSIYHSEDDFFKNLHQIIDGPLDGDRLDYVTRDVNNSGISAGKIEYKRILPTMRLEFSDDDNFVFCPSTKVINSIDDFFIRRWDLYKKIIYHHRAVKTDYLLAKSVEDIALNYLKENTSIPTNDNELLNIKENSDEDDNSSNLLPNDISGLWRALEDKWSKIEFSYSIVQWDDNWLLTILKQHYFTRYIDGEDSTTLMLDEFLTNKKVYYTIIKEMVDFLPLDTEFADVLQKKSGALKKKLIELSSYTELLASSPLDSEAKHFSDMACFFSKLISVLDYATKITNTTTETLQKSDGFILSKVKFEVFSPDRFNDNTICTFDKYIETHYDEMKMKFPNIVEDLFFVSKKSNSGLNKTLYLYEQMGPNTVKLREYQINTSVKKRLDNEISLFPPFFIFVKHKSSFDIATVYHEDFCKKLGSIMGNSFVNYFDKVADVLEKQISEALK